MTRFTVMLSIDADDSVSIKDLVSRLQQFAQSEKGVTLCRAANWVRDREEEVEAGLEGMPLSEGPRPTNPEKPLANKDIFETRPPY